MAQIIPFPSRDATSSGELGERTVSMPAADGSSIVASATVISSVRRRRMGHWRDREGGLIDASQRFFSRDLGRLLDDPLSLGEAPAHATRLLASAIDGEDEHLAQKAIAVLPVVRHVIDDEALISTLEKALLGRLFDVSMPLSRRESLAAVLATVSSAPMLSPVVLSRLSDPVPEHRLVAAIAAGAPGHEAALDPLTALLDDVDVRVREAAVFGLSGLKDGVLDEELLRRLKARLAMPGLCDSTRLAVITNLKLFDHPSLEALFLAHLDDSLLEIRLAALGAFFFGATEVAMAAVRAALEDVEPRIRLMALAVIERHGGKTELEAVFARFGDAEPRVQQLARDVAQQIRRRAENPTLF